MQKYFDRHKHMTEDVHREILDIICETESSTYEIYATLINYLYGLFDGYNYVDEIRAIIKTKMISNKSLVRKLKNDLCHCGYLPSNR